MSEKCCQCDRDINKKLDFFNENIEYGYKLFDFCKHIDTLIPTKYLCIQCNINQHYNNRCCYSNKNMKSMTCIKWKTGQSNELYCWKNHVPMCDVLNCNYPAINTYVKLEDFINLAKNNFYSAMDLLSINVPIEIFNIIINYTYKIHPKGNGLCINHNTQYDISIGWIFNPEMECTTCFDRLNIKQGLMINFIRQYYNYFYGNITLHHKSSDICNPIIKIDDNNFSSGGCLELCKQLNTWCEICKKCIGHTNNINDIYTHNILKYPHCILCDAHSEYPHCNKCGAHSEYPHCTKCSIHSKYQHCNTCNDHCIIYYKHYNNHKQNTNCILC
jgi:hypothetical protein